jgi:hypothetical protein
MQEKQRINYMTVDHSTKVEESRWSQLTLSQAMKGETIADEERAQTQGVSTATKLVTGKH